MTIIQVSVNMIISIRFILGGTKGDAKEWGS